MGNKLSVCCYEGELQNDVENRANARGKTRTSNLSSSFPMQQKNTIMSTNENQSADQQSLTSVLMSKQDPKVIDKDSLQERRMTQESRRQTQESNFEDIDWERIVRDIRLHELFDEFLNIFDCQYSEEYLKQNQYLKICDGLYGEEKIFFKAFMKDMFIGEDRYQASFQQFGLDKNMEDYIYWMSLMTNDQRTKIDKNVEDASTLKVFKKDGIVYFFSLIKTHKIQFRPIIEIKGKEILVVKALKKLPDGRFLEVFKTFEHKAIPCGDDRIRLEISKAGGIYKQETGDDNKVICGTANTHMIMNAKVNVPLKLIKPFVSGYYKRVFKTTFDQFKVWQKDLKEPWDESILIRD